MFFNHFFRLSAADSVISGLQYIAIMDEFRVRSTWLTLVLINLFTLGW